jgi:hypothetical protein
MALAKTKANPIEDTNGKDIYKALLASAGRHVRQAVKVPAEARYAPLAKTFFAASEAKYAPLAKAFFDALDTMEQKAHIPAMYYNSKKLSRQARQAEEVPAPEAEAEVEVPAPEAEVAAPEA